MTVSLANESLCCACWGLFHWFPYYLTGSQVASGYQLIKDAILYSPLLLCFWCNYEAFPDQLAHDHSRFKFQLKINRKKRNSVKKVPDGPSHLLKQGQLWVQDSLGLLPAPPTACWHFCCLPLPPLQFAVILSLKIMWVGREEEVRGTEKMGRKGKKIMCFSNSHMIVNLLLSEFSKGSPHPSFICLACTLEAGTQKLCLLLPAPAAKAWRQLWGPGTAWFMNSKERVLLEPASGSQRPGQKSSW